MRSLRFISAIVVLSAAGSTLPARAQNLLSNPNFDAGLTGWVATGNTTFTFDGVQGSPNAGSSAATLIGSLNVGVDAPVANTNDIMWRNDTSGKLVVWFMDNARNRTSGSFTTPDSPSSPLSWTVAGPR